MRSAIFSSSLLLLSAVFVSTAFGTPIDPSRGGVEGECKNPIQRKEWRTLSDDEKMCYIDAVKCLQQLPPITAQTVPGAISRFEDFQGAHLELALTIHYVGRFLPWHRYFMGLYENALRVECGYQGAQPYWDWTLDVDDFANSPLFDPTTGFGGNGSPAPCNDARMCPPGGTGGGCIQDGPFKDHVVHMGPWNDTGTSRNDYCLKRNFNPGIAKQFLEPAVVQKSLEQTTFDDYILLFGGIKFSFAELGQHGGGHVAVGGVMADFFASPGDPMFYMHHAAVDWVWWLWQSRDLPARLEEISGGINIDDPSMGNTTLATTINVGLLGPEVTVADVMDIKGGLLCYEYA